MDIMQQLTDRIRGRTYQLFTRKGQISALLKQLRVMRQTLF